MWLADVYTEDSKASLCLVSAGVKRRRERGGGGADSCKILSGAGYSAETACSWLDTLHVSLSLFPPILFNSSSLHCVPFFISQGWPYILCRAQTTLLTHSPGGEAVHHSPPPPSKEDLLFFTHFSWQLHSGRYCIQFQYRLYRLTLRCTTFTVPQ